jgi:hypothetical protein
VKKIIPVLFLFVGCGTFVNDSNTVRAVEKQGYTNVQINKKHVVFPDWCGCSKDDDAAYDMTATNPAGKQVNIIACAGITKGVTVRTW